MGTGSMGENQPMVKAVLDTLDDTLSSGVSTSLFLAVLCRLGLPMFSYSLACSLTSS